ncbi:tectonic-3-like isoform X4 [Labeo rohita]|uniref:tectonic-3-like isoform X4 n=1 Tax=Labeo rohita TaxID=84645 RepID=UPI0021E1D26E|nr:tectonic-3-like isoform X4 [Labeo rohita]
MSNGIFYRFFHLVLIPLVCSFPQEIYCQNTAQHDPINSSVSPASAALSATFTDDSAVLSTDATIELTSPAGEEQDAFMSKKKATNSESTTQSIIDQTPKSTDLTQYPLAFTDKAPTITNQLGLTTTEVSNELRAEINSTDSTNLTDSSATATLNNGTFIAGSDVLPTHATTEPTTIHQNGCLCDVTPDFCDIGCCCDVMDCGLMNLSSVFNSCSLDVGSGICLENWLVFRAQIDPALVTLTGNLFCVQREKEKQSAAQASPVHFQPKSLYPFLLRELTAFNNQKNNFYKVDDIILTYYGRTSMVSTLRQPSPGPTSSACINHNPARFLRSSSLSCSRAVTACSCVDDSSLNALTYYTGFSLLRIPISMVSDWPEPRHQNGSCLNVVSKVEYVIKYTSKGEIAEATLNIELMNTTADTQLLQKHVVIFQLDRPTPPMPTLTPPSPPEGLKLESSLVGWFGENAQALTVLGLSEDGGCSASLANRPPVLFRQNTVTGCTFRSLSSACGVLRAELLSVLAGAAVPELISMTAGSQTKQSRVISQDCSTSALEACETGCLLPVSLSVQVLWAQRGLSALPQNHILGAKFIFGCQKFKCPLRSSIPVTTEVIFSDATVYPEAPWGELQPEWKFPYPFFPRAGQFAQD